MSDPVLVTGSAGFIGFHTARRLLARGETVIGVDNLNSYYDPALKQARLDRLRPEPAVLDHAPSVPIDVGVRRFVEGYRDFHQV